MIVIHPFATTAAFPLSLYTKRLIFIARKNVLAKVGTYCSSVPVKYIRIWTTVEKFYSAIIYYLIYIIRADTRCTFKRFTIYLIF